MKVKTIRSFFPGINTIYPIIFQNSSKDLIIFKFLNCYYHVEDAEKHIFHAEMILSERVFDTRRMPCSERVNVLGNRILWKFKYGNNIFALLPISLTLTIFLIIKYILILFLFSIDTKINSQEIFNQIKTQ